jgi:hypothetical protein
MSLDDRHEMAQLEGLGAELAEAGHLARTASARRTTPDPEFAARLRAELLGSLPQPLPVPMAVGRINSGPCVSRTTSRPMPPARR